MVKAALLLDKTPIMILSSASSTPEDRCLARLWEHKKFNATLTDLKSTFELDNPENIKAFRSMGVRNKKKPTKKPDSKAKTSCDGVGKVKKEKKLSSQKKVAMEFEEESLSENEGEQSVDGKNTKIKQKKVVNPSSEKLSEKARPKKPKQKPVSDDEDDSNVEEKTIDSFFVTNTGQSYLAAVSKPKTNTDHGLPSQKFTNNYEKPRSQKSFEQDNAFKENRKKQFDENDSNDNLHPSWKAKQRLKEIKPFQGKKMVFSDEGTVAEVKLPKNMTTTQNADPSLHPSWIAKQKAKPVIAEFTGKKIKFD